MLKSTRTKISSVAVAIVARFALASCSTIFHAFASDCTPVPTPTCFSADPKSSSK